MGQVRLVIDGTEVEVPTGANLVAATRAAGVYVPTLCHLADLPPSPAEHACGLCLVRVEGEAEPVRACETTARDGLRVSTNDPELASRRRAALGRILEGHPHACLRCAQREGCAREPCPTDLPAEERCCPMLSDCELVRLVDAVGLPEDLARHVPAGLPVEEDPLFARDPNLCVACGRCVRACEHLRGVAAIELVEEGGRLVVRPKGGGTAASGCRHCGTCVEVCPTGARRDVGEPPPTGPDEILACRNACPAGVDVPLCVALMAEGRAAEAQAVVRNRVPLPFVLGRVCHRPCEDECRRGRLSDPIAICDLNRVAAAAGAEPPIAGADSGESVAIVGGGPAGLSAAYYLRLLGHAATVFEAEAEPGGRLRCGVPPERHLREAFAKDLLALEDLGVSFVTGARLGDGLTLAGLAADFDGVVIATGRERDPAVVAEARRAVPVPVVEAGDFATGPSDAAAAVGSGREAARAVHRMLGFAGGIPEFVPDPLPSGRLPPRRNFPAIPRAPLPLDAGTAAEEADRCLRCDLRFAVELPPGPPGAWRPLLPEEVERVPPEPGVVTFLDATGKVLAIQGTPDLRSALAAPPSGTGWFAFDLSAADAGRASEFPSRPLSTARPDLVDDDLL